MSPSPRPEIGDRFDEAPADRSLAHLDVRELQPPEPLRQTLEQLAGIDADTVLVQTNDRAPQHRYPRLAERGYAYETTETGDAVVTAIWEA